MTLLKCTVNGYSIEYVDEGIGSDDRPTLVFAHGLGGNVRQWTAQVAHFKQDYRVVVFSLQGHGASSRGDAPEAYRIEAYADTATALLETLGVTRVVWVGNSMGGVIGYEVLKRGVVDVVHLVTNGTTPALKMSKATLKFVKWADKAIIKVFGFEAYIKLAAAGTTKDKAFRAQLYDMMMMTAPEAVVASHQLLGDYDYTGVLTATAVPVTIIRAPGDAGIEKALDSCLKDLEAPMLTVQTVSSGGHILNMEKPDFYNRHLEAVLKN